MAAVDAGGSVVTVQPVGTGGRRRLEYKSEYKKSFRPFSNYEYVGGRFVPASSSAAATAAHSLASVHVPATTTAAATAVPISSSSAVEPTPQQPKAAVSLHGEPWYSEVIELRKQANDYKVTKKKPITQLWFSSFTYYY